MVARFELLVRIALREAVDFLSQLAECFQHLLFVQPALARAHVDVADPGDHSGLQFGSFLSNLTLLKVLIDPNTPASVKVRAAEAIFSHSSKAIEIEDIEARLSELERAAEASKPGHTRRSR